MNKGTELWMAAKVDGYLERLQRREDKLAARKAIIRQLRQQVRERNGELAQLKDGQKADDEHTGRSPEDTKEQKADDELKNGQKADDEQEKLDTG
jgi:hypothetical protein